MSAALVSPRADLIHGDCREELRRLEARSVDCVVTDTPYEYKGGFMGASWDREGTAFDPDLWRSVARAAKPGAWVAAFGGRQSWHRLACAMEDGGLVPHDTVMWVYTTGNVTNKHTQLKTAWEPILLMRVDPGGSIKRALEMYGTGYLNIDACRIPYADEADLAKTLAKNPGRTNTFTSGVYGTNRPQQLVNVEGRHPANIMFEEDVAVTLGSDARYFVCPKASRAERDAGLSIEHGIARNPHTCVKPLSLMSWLVRLLCPEGGTVLDHFAGSGSTGVAALGEGRSCLAIEREDIYVETARLRLDHARGEEA
jgi:DNA modification methylase